MLIRYVASHTYRDLSLDMRHIHWDYNQRSHDNRLSSSYLYTRVVQPFHGEKLAWQILNMRP
jgi:hypothetical protein